MLGTYQIVTPFNNQWSHNVAHSCDHATFTVDCCYDILQHLLRICVSTKASVNSRLYITQHRQTVEIFTIGNLQTKCILSVSLIRLLCGGLWYKVNPPIRRMQSPSKNFGIF